VSFYPYISGDGVPVAHPLFQTEGDGAIPVSPLQLSYHTVDVPTAIQLNALWHSRLPKVVRGNIDRNRRKVCYVAECGNRYYAVAIWSDPVAANRLKDGDKTLELRRMAISDIAPENTASNMLGWMKRDIKKRFPELVKLVSYQDTVVHSGTIYKAAGWLSASATSTLIDWNVNGRERKPNQSDAPKLRWEVTL
jgi:hypothetical protein